MPKKILNIIDQAYRATLDEQDDTVLWLVHMMKSASSDVSILLRGAAINFAVRGQDASGIRFGELAQSRPPKLDDDLRALQGKGVSIRYVEEDLAERGIDRTELLEGVAPMKRGELATAMAGYDLVFAW